MNTSNYHEDFSWLLLLSFLWGGCGLMFVLWYPSSDWQATAGVLMASQAFCGALAWHRLRLTAGAVLPDFLTFFLLLQLANKTLTLLGQVIKGTQDSFGEIQEILLSRDLVPIEYQYQAELVFLLAMVLFTLTCLLLEGRTSPPAVWEEPATEAVWWTYGLALLAYLGLTISAVGQSLGMTQDLMKYFSIGAVALLLGGRSEFALGSKRAWLAVLALMPFYVFAFRSGMKSEIALVSLPLLIPAVRNLNLNRSLLFGGFLVCVVLVVFPFTEAWRSANWAGQENQSIATVASHVFSSWAEDGLLQTATASTGQWLVRSSSADAGGLVMELAERDGLLGPVLIEGLATIFIPRFLWPDKPLYRPGAWFTWYLGQAPSPEEATSSTAMMLPTELYWMFGVWGVFVGMPALGILYFYIWRGLMRRAERGLIASVALFAQLISSAALESNHTIYAISSPIILFIYVLSLEQVQRHFFPGLSPRPISNRASL